MKMTGNGAPWALVAMLALVAIPALADEPTEPDGGRVAAEGDGEGSGEAEEGSGIESGAEPATSVSTEAETAEEDDADHENDDAAAALGAANPVVSGKQARPWQLMGNVGLSMGSSSFTQNTEFQASYSVSLTGLYRLTSLWQGRLDALASVRFDQELDPGYVSAFGSTSPNQLFFRDIRLGVLGRGLYKWKKLGLTFGANSFLDLPTSENAQFWGRYLRWTIGVNAVDFIQNVGPGNLLVSASFNFRKDIGEVNPTVNELGNDGSIQAVCRGVNQGNADTCLTDLAPLNFAMFYGGSVRYFLGSWSLGLGITFVNNFNHSLNDSALDGTLEAGVPASSVSSSAFAQDAPDHSMLYSAGLSLTYVISKNFNVNAGISTFRSVYRGSTNEDGEFNPREVSLPFDLLESGLTSANLSFTAMY